MDNIANILLMQIVINATREAEVADPALTEELEWESFLFQEPEIVAMCILFTLEDDLDKPRDIIKIIQSCLKDAKKCKIRHVVKIIMQLVAVSEYIKLHMWYKKHKVYKHCHCKSDEQSVTASSSATLGSIVKQAG